jgi:hypothetical protein
MTEEKKQQVTAHLQLAVFFASALRLVLKGISKLKIKGI